ncbi:MAG: carbon starvation protein A [Anaerolineae bacterium]
MSLVVLIVGIAVAVVAYQFYGRRIDQAVIEADPAKATPATMYQDGVDFTPASRNVLVGYQFKSIAALGPIVGPVVAVQFGWLPTLLWLLLGVFFIGWLADYGSAMIAMRHEGKTFGGLSYELISPRARTILLIFIYFYLLLVMGAFGYLVALLLSNPKTPFGLLALCLVGLLAGQMIYRMRRDILQTTVITVVLALIGVWIGTLSPVAGIFTAINGGPESPALWALPGMAGSFTQALLVWSIVTFAFCYLGSVLPIWRWAQPINYIGFYLVALALVGTAIGIVVWRPGFGDFPAFAVNAFSPGHHLGPIWPILFVTVSCGAVSGWHTLFSSTGSARQLAKETDALPVAGGSMLGEMVVGVISVIVAMAAYVAAQKYAVEAGVIKIQAGALGVYSVGMAAFLNKIGIPMDFGVALAGVFLVIMAITTMQLALRFMRVASAEWLGDAIPAFKNPHVGSIVAAGLSVLLVWTGFWQRIWVLFGGANQLMAGLALLLITLWMIREGKPNLWVGIPAIFLYATTCVALLLTAWKTWQAAIKPGVAAPIMIANVIAALIAVVLVVAALILAWDGWGAIQKFRAARAAPAMDV